MLKTYLYIPENLYKQIQLLVKREKKSKAEIIRTALKKGLKELNVQHNGGAEVLLKLAELGKKHKLRGPKDLAINHNKYLWGIEFNDK